MSAAPRVTALIPTLGTRPQLLRRALDSVWQQQHVDVDVVIVRDGPGGTPFPADVESNPRVRIIDLPEHRGQRRALDAGVAVARAPWVAFLDDDDEWHHPRKLALQLEAAAASPGPVIVSSRVVLDINGTQRRVAPPRAWTPDIDLGEFAFCADRCMTVGLVQQSTLLVPTPFLREHPLGNIEDPHPDIELVLEAMAAGAAFIQLPEALSTWHVDDHRQQVSTSRSWRTTLAWCDDHRDLLTPHAYAGTLLTAGARCVDARRAMLSIWRRAWRNGSPRPLDLIASLYLAYFPLRFRRRLGAARADSKSR